MRYPGFSLANNLFVAPMAGVTDRPFRQLCKRMGAGLAVSEMVTSNSLLYGSAKTQRRANHDGEVAPITVQIAGSDPAMMAAAARHNIERGAQIIDINMGCPAKKICHVMAGSALMKDEALIARILDAVVQAAGDTPVTLKTRTGWDMSHKNVLNILAIAENVGVRALTIHGRTRCQQYSGEAEYEMIRLAKERARIPIIANGDIATPEKARLVLEATGADALMIGRAAQGRPWIFREIAHYLNTGSKMPPPKVSEIHTLLREHLEDLYAFYGLETGVRVARKHIGWYTKGMADSAAFRYAMNRLPDIEQQRRAVDNFFTTLAERSEQLEYENNEHWGRLAA
ncbi:MAG: tRNA-dihydrouridine synthase C [Betaproteobacteria bacterium ADurb.Bin341]|nr:MAG: tRNA-dihydrouridine synthase C [Betaproteobacteria bacterium ADurb.Bin341]